MGKIKSIILKDSERLALETGFRQGDSHCFRMRCRAVLLKSTGLSSKAIGLQTEMSHAICLLLDKTFLVGRHRRLADPSRPWAKTYHGLYRQEVVRKAIEQGQAERQQSSRSLAEGHLARKRAT